MSGKTQVSTAPSPRRKKNRMPAEIDAHLESLDRRRFLSRSMAMAGTALASGTAGIAVADAAPLPVPESNQGMGKPIPATEYGVPSKFEKHVVRRRTDVFVNRQNWSDWSMTPDRKSTRLNSSHSRASRMPSSA